MNLVFWDHNENVSNDICPKCSNFLDKDGLCWHCLTNEYKKSKKVVERIEREGIKSWATSVGYQLEIGKINRIAKIIGYDLHIDIRERNKNLINEKGKS